MTFDQADQTYPYDPTAVPERLVGLEKLRAFSDPKMRRLVWELWTNTTGRVVAPKEHAELHAAFEDNSSERYP